MLGGRISRGIVAVLAAAAVVAPSACSEQKGGLMLAVNTDMQVPKDVSLISVTVFTNDAVKFNTLGRVRPDGSVELPSTLAIAEPDDANATVRVRVMAFQDQKPRVLRDIRTTVPHKGRIAYLRVPLNFLDDKSGTGEIPIAQLPPGGASEFDPTPFVTTCPDPLQTSVDGVCKDPTIDSSTLPDWDPSLAPSEDQGCFDPSACLAGAREVDASELDLTTCTVSAAGKDPAKLNFAFKNADTGLCVKPGECYVPLEQSEHGWLPGDRLKLTPGACSKYLSKGVVKLAMSTACAPWDPKLPLCRKGGTTDVDAGTDASGDSGVDAGPAPPPGGTFTTRVGEWDRAGALSGRNFQMYVTATEGFVTVSASTTTTVDGTSALPAGEHILRLIDDTIGGFYATDKGHIYSSGNTMAPLDGSLSPTGGFGIGGWRSRANATGSVWLVGGGPDVRGVYTRDTSVGPAITRQAGVVLDDDPTAIIDEYYGVYLGTKSGKIYECWSYTCSSGKSLSATSNAPVEGAFRSNRSPLGNTLVRYYVLTRDSIYMIDGAQGVTNQPLPPVTRVVAGNFQGFVDVEGSYRPRTIVGDDVCVYVSGPYGVEWFSTADPTKHGYVATATFGSTNDTWVGGIAFNDQSYPPTIFWSRYAPKGAGGGVYRSEAPPECNGPSKGTKGNVVGPCAMYGECMVGPDCCSGTCNNGSCVTP